MQQENKLIPQIYQTHAIHQETEDVFTLTLLPMNKNPFVFQPGQFNMLCAFGIGEVAISLSGDPEKTNLITHTIRKVGAVTKKLSHLKKGDYLGVRGPFGIGWPTSRCKQKEIVIIAGGIGIAPLRSLLYQLLKQEEKPAKVTLIYGARTPKDMIFINEIESMRDKLTTFLTVDRVTDMPWHHHIGVNMPLIAKAIDDPLQTMVFMCGPEVMMKFCVHTLKSHHVPTEQIYLSLERNMHCAIGHCGHCQWGPYFICKDGPVFPLQEIEPFLYKTEL